jgi:hypothetical protein
VSYGKSTIYFLPFLGKKDLSVLTRELLKEVDLPKLLLAEGYVPIKVQIDFVDRPSFIEIAREIARECAHARAVPYLTDTTSTILLQDRKASMFEWTELALKKGISASYDIPLLPLDGPCGSDGLFVPIIGKELAATYVSNALLHSSNLIVLTCVTCDPLTGLEGGMKSLGFGCVTLEGKKKLHEVIKPAILRNLCTKCGKCDVCSQNAIMWSFGYPAIITEMCVGCMKCFFECEEGAINVMQRQIKRYNMRLVDTCLGVKKMFKGKILYVNLIAKITPHSAKFPNKPIIPDLGILASTDPVAIDKASLDLINNEWGIRGTAAEICNVLEPGKNKIEAITGFDPNYTFKLAESLGLGSTTYELIEVKSR